MIAVLTCGPLFDEKALVEEGGIFNFLDLLLSSKDKKVGEKRNILRDHIKLYHQRFQHSKGKPAYFHTIFGTLPR